MLVLVLILRGVIDGRGFGRMGKRVFSRGHATLELAVSVCRSVRHSVIMLFFEVFRYSPPVHDWGGR